MMTFTRNALISTLLCCLFSQAYAGLLINPKRVVLEDRDRAASLDLLNEGQETIRYQIFFEQKRLNKEGKIVDVENPDEGGPYAKDMIRYSPRRVDIPPGGKQTIRLAVRRPKDLANGEFLSHLVFKEIPAKEPVSVVDSDLPDEVLQLTFKPTLRIAIPVIVRKGELSATADISKAEFIADDGEFGSVVFQLHRDGDASLYGSVEVYEQTGAGLGERIGFGRGVALYTSLSERKVRLTLNKALKPGANQLLLRFDEAGKYGGNNLIEASIQLH